MYFQNNKVNNSSQWSSKANRLVYSWDKPFPHKCVQMCTLLTLKKQQTVFCVETVAEILFNGQLAFDYES